MIIKGLIAVIVVMALVIVWGKFQILTLEKENQALVIERDAALASVATLEETLAFQVAQVAEIGIKLKAMAEENALARKQVAYTRNLFADHDFQNLMKKKPGLITNRMQKATDAVFDDLTAITTQ